jgi:hypothetical protein
VAGTSPAPSCCTHFLALLVTDEALLVKAMYVQSATAAAAAMRASSRPAPWRSSYDDPHSWAPGAALCWREPLVLLERCLPALPAFLPRPAPCYTCAPQSLHLL